MLLLQTGDGQLPADESVSARALEGEKKIADRKLFSRLIKICFNPTICVQHLILWGKTQINSVKRHDHKYCHSGYSLSMK